MSIPANQPGGSYRPPDWPATRPVLPLIAASENGPLSRWSTASEQYLDSIKAVKIAAYKGQDQKSENSNLLKPHFAKVSDTEHRAAGLKHITLLSKASNRADSPKTATTIAVAGLAAEAWEEDPMVGVLCAYCPKSWHHPEGIKKILRGLMPYLPDVAGALFLTLTFDRRLFEGPLSAHSVGRPKIRKIMDQLRKGVEWNGKLYKIDAPYCVKLEFHEDDEGWPHYHLIVLIKNRFLPVELLAELWDNGFCKVKRITNTDFHYLLSYVTKGNGEYPEWAKSLNRLRIFQPSHGFMLPRPAKPVPPTPVAPVPLPEGYERPTRASYTIGERLYRWARMALLNEGGKFRTLILPAPFRQIFDVLILSIAEANRYLGNGFIKINEKKELIPWTLNPSLL